MFELIDKNGLKYYSAGAFEKTGAVRHGFSTRLGGVSKGCYATVNLRMHSGDDMDNVLENFRRVCRALGMDHHKLVLSKQVHEDNIADVTMEDAGNGILYENKFISADALITNTRGLPISVFSADCVPVLFLDAKRGVIAAAHSGWRGTVLKIAGKTAEKMISQYGSEPEDIIAAIGPSIQEDCFEVGDDVARIFIDAFGEETAVKRGGRYHVNMQRAIIGQLERAGIPRGNIDDCAIQTCCIHTEKWETSAAIRARSSN